MEKIKKIFKDQNRKYLAGLAGLAVLNALIYWLALLRPAIYFNYYKTPYLDPNYYIHGGIGTIVRLVFALTVLGISYWYSWKWASRIRSNLGWLIIIGGALVYAGLLLYMAPFASNDIFDYIIHGRILGIYQSNPFKVVANQFPSDIFTYYAGWPGTPSAYGPLWEIMAGVTAVITGDGVVQNVLAFKILSGLFYFGSIGMVALILLQRKDEKALGRTLLLAWNPIILYEVWGNGHNDITMIFWVLLAAWAIERKHFITAVLALVAGALIKFMPILLVPAAGLIALRELHSTKERTRFIVATTLLAGTLVAVTYIPFWQGLKTLTIDRRTHLFTASLASTIFTELWPKIGYQEAANTVSQAAILMTFAFALWQTIRAVRNRSEDGFATSAFSMLAFYLLVTVLWFWPWYTIWLIALAPIVNSREARNLAIIFGFSAFGKYLVMAFQLLMMRTHLPPLWDEVWTMLAIMGVPWAYALYSLLSEKPQESQPEEEVLLLPMPDMDMQLPDMEIAKVKIRAE